MSDDYAAFLERKRHSVSLHGFEPVYLPEWLFPFQRTLVEWAVRKGRAAIFADCGMGKTPMQLVWAQNVVMHTRRPVLLLTPLAVGGQTLTEAGKFGIAAVRSRDGRFDCSAGIVITNYEKLHLFEPADFGGVVCDESSILKHFTGATQKQVTRFMTKVDYRLLCTATAAPNDYIELGTSAEALGEMGYSDMLGRFFKQDQNKPHRMEEVKQWRADKLAEHEQKRGDHFAKLAYRVSQQIGQWRLKGHAVEPFWRWVASWGRACRKPSDLGFEDGAFILPDLVERDHIVTPERPPDGYLFEIPAVGLQEERAERRRTLNQRCELAAQLVAHDRPAVVWCHLNAEGDLLERLIPDCVQVAGSDSDEAKEDAYRRFADGSVRVLVIKPKIGAWGMNWQHCNHVVTFATHSYEQYYQAVRRCWRFGQDHPVTVDIIATEGEANVRENMRRKAQAADVMFAQLVTHMHDALTIVRPDTSTTSVELPVWVS